MKFSSLSSLFAIAYSSALLIMMVHAAPMEVDDEQVENGLVLPDNIGDIAGQWDSIDTNALRRLLLQIDEERLLRSSRSLPPKELRGWGPRSIDSRITRQWRADKRQVRFRQCYFNPISCFRK